MIARLQGGLIGLGAVLLLLALMDPVLRGMAGCQAERACPNQLAHEQERAFPHG
jgi:hypothetical protein